MNIFIIGISGSIGSNLARRLHDRGDSVRGLVRRADQKTEFERSGIDVSLGDLATVAGGDLSRAIGDADTIVFAAGSNGGSPAVTASVDGDGVEKALAAARLGGRARFALVSVLPESWRERDLGADVEYYFSVKKKADIAVTRSGLDWLILRPSLLVDTPGVGTVCLGPAESHGEIARDDVAEVLAELLHDPRITRQILEVDGGSIPIPEAVRANRGPV